MGYDMYTAEGGNYFRLNIFGMRYYRDIMFKLKMGFDSQWPALDVDPKDYDIKDHEEAWVLEEKAEQGEVDDRWLRYQEARDNVLKEHGGDSPGIPLHKFGSNDGWWVTPEEIDHALAVYDKYMAEESGRDFVDGVVNDISDREYWDQWIDYLRHARNEGGFRVH